MNREKGKKLHFRIVEQMNIIYLNRHRNEAITAAKNDERRRRKKNTKKALEKKQQHNKTPMCIVHMYCGIARLKIHM